MKWYIKTRKDIKEINLTDKDLYHLERMVYVYQSEMNEMHIEGDFNKRVHKRMEQSCDSLLLLVEAMIKGQSIKRG